MECIASTKQDRHRRKMALQLNVHRIRQGMRTAEQLRFSRRQGSYASQRHSSPVEGQPSRPATPEEANHESSNGLSDIFNTARIESDLEDGDDGGSVLSPSVTNKASGEHERSICCKCDQASREHDRRIRRRLIEVQTVILEDRMVSQVVSSRMTWYYLYATMLLEFWNLEQHVEGTGQGASGFVGRALKSMFNARRRAMQMGSKLKKKSKSKMQDSSDSTGEKKD
ncbi:uncharacterized protein LOC135714298 [Ochlerotatus camptorhynchus]|uniref:uncharacterized protein LOC135714298 n=1 Tax=Ochlerotatus camptorhynchus TaxID=644619 RepID=UPI0031DA82A8